MSSGINTGGPAFPRNILDHGHGVATTHESGMTMRDYFAGQAISQIIATCANDTTHGMTKADYFAGRAYEIADAMLKARETP